MATAVTPAVAIGAVATLVSVPTDQKAKMKSITIDNQGAGQHTIFFRDSFTPDPYDAAPGAVTPARGQYTVPAGIMAVIDSLALVGREFIGAMQCYADAAEPLCIVTVDYELT
jgi:hypothetical protein